MELNDPTRNPCCGFEFAYKLQRSHLLRAESVGNKCRRYDKKDPLLIKPSTEVLLRSKMILTSALLSAYTKISHEGEPPMKGATVRGFFVELS